MSVEKDLEKIKRTAKAKKNENIEFRSFLKNADIASTEIDAIVHKVYKDVVDQIDCTECANCCNTKKPALDDADIKKFVSSLEMKEDVFRKNYLAKIEPDGNGNKYEFTALPCPFLKNNLCGNYHNRPKDCESFPHLHENGFTARLWGVIDNYAICPIVFNVYEELKTTFWRKR